MIFGVCVFCFIMYCSSCNQSTNSVPTLPLEEPDPDFCRITMGMGFADKNDDYLYVNTPTYLYEMDLETKKVLPVKKVSTDPLDLNLVDNKIYYGVLFSGSIRSFDFETFEDNNVYDEAYTTDVYINDRYIYALTGRGGSLVRIDSESGEAIELAPAQVFLYDKFGSELYYLYQPDEETPSVMKCFNEHTGTTTEYDLPFEPISLYVTQDYIYLIESGVLIDGQYHYQMYRYNKENGDVERIEGVDQAYNYFVINDRIYYEEEYTYKLICYSLTDHSKEVIVENNVGDLTVFSDESIVISKFGDEADADTGRFYLQRNENGEWEQTKVRPE